MAYQPATIRTVDERHSEGLIACFACRFWDGNHPDPTAPGLVEKEGRCRRYAPAVGGWPPTKGEDWCAEFLPLTPTPAPNPEAVSHLTPDQIAAMQEIIRSTEPHECRYRPILKDPGRGMRARVNAVEGEVPGE
jgi:hypothetical protein